MIFCAIKMNEINLQPSDCILGVQLSTSKIMARYLKLFQNLQTSELHLAGTIGLSLLITPVNVITNSSTVSYGSLINF